MQFQVNKKKVISALLHQEDTLGNKRITKDDTGPKKFTFEDLGGKKHIIEGTYHLSNFLQELALCNSEIADVDMKNIYELPLDRVSRLIKDYHWKNLSRTIDEQGLLKIVSDDKVDSEMQKIYVPSTDHFAIDYYQRIAKKYEKVEVVILPKDITPEYVSSINNESGILSLALDTTTQKGKPFVVPGGRFNEMYGWDSYFINQGLLVDEKQEWAKGMIDNFGYQITHYGKILNANRTYYLTRTQPPFYTSMIREYLVNYPQTDKSWIKDRLQEALKEYFEVWMVEGKRLTKNGLNRYFAEGIGMPPETEEGHFDFVMDALRGDSTLEEFKHGYYSRNIESKELDEYFLHDRSVRESGHDTTYRLDGNCAHMNVVDLNALLYKYEADLAYLIATYFDDFIEYKGRKVHSEFWKAQMANRKLAMNKYLWVASENCFLDYHTLDQKNSTFIAASSFFPLWANMCSQEQADKMVKEVLPKLSFEGGIAGCTHEALSNVPKDAPQRQWDYPFGWAPHQMMIWKGLANYGYHDVAQNLAYKWIKMMVQTAKDYNGAITEKYDVVAASHLVHAEYGNVGSDFELVPKGGFGWMNSSFKVGLEYLSKKQITELNSI